MSIRAVIFDIGGVLLRSDSKRGARKWEQRLGLAEGELERVVWKSELRELVMAGQATEGELWAHVAVTYNLSWEDVYALWHEMISQVFLDTELVNFLRGLRPRYRTALLSNAGPEEREELMGKHSLGDVVDVVILTSEDGVAKPDVRSYHLAAERLGVRSCEALFVDDTFSNIVGAQRAGMQTILFIQTQQAIADILSALEG